MTEPVNPDGKTSPLRGDPRAATTVWGTPQGAAASNPMAERLGDFRLIREIGRGGMGIVYEAEQMSLGRHVALKTLSTEMLADPTLRLRFEREARAAAKLHHTNIVPVFGVGECEGRIYYAMQYIHGMPLDVVLEELKRLANADHSPGVSRSGGAFLAAKDFSLADVVHSYMTAQALAGIATTVDREPLATTAPLSHTDVEAEFRGESTGSHAPSGAPSSGRLSGTVVIGNRTTRLSTYWHQVAQIGVQVAFALDYAHAQGVLHRDIKPSNLVLDAQGTVWVTDFGLAKLDNDRGLTQTGDILGTLRYMAPEVFKGKSDARSEVYSLGLTLYELLTLRPAFDQTHRAALIDQVMNAAMPALGECNPLIPVDLQTIVHKAIERDPSQRYPTARALAEDLQRFLRDEPIVARPISSLERVTRWSRQNRGLAAALSTMAALVTFIAISSTIAAGYFRTISERLAETVADLQVAQETATEQAVENLKLAQDAEEARREAQTRLADLQTHQGLVAANQGNAATAMLWFAHAARQTPHDPARQRENRLRARNWMNEAVLPVAVFPSRDSSEWRRLAFQPGGTLLLAVQKRNFILWDWRIDQMLPWAEELTGVVDAVWSADGQQVAVALNTGAVQLRLTSSGAVRHTLEATSGVQTLAFSPKGEWLVVGGQSVGLWKLSDPPVRAAEWPHPQPVAAVAFNRAGTRLVTYAQDHQVRLFEISDQGSQPLATFGAKPHRPYLASPPVFMDNDRKLVTVASNSQGIHWWNVETGAEEPPASFSGTAVATVHHLAASAEGDWLAAATFQNGELWMADGTHRQLKHANHLTSIAFTPDRAVITSCFDWGVRQWSLTDDQLPPVAMPHLAVPDRCALSTDGEFLAVGGGPTLRVWKRPQQNLVVGGAKEWKHRFWFARPSFDGRLATPGLWREPPHGIDPISSLTVVQWPSGQPAGPEIQLPTIVDSCLCSDNSTVAIVAQKNERGALAFYEVATGAERHSPIELPSQPQSVAARGTQPHVAVLCTSGICQIFDHRTGQQVLEIPHTNHASSRCPRAQYTPDESSLVIQVDNDLYVHAANTGELRYPPIRPVLQEGPCRTFTISADSRWLATGVNGRNAVQVWDLATGKPACDPLLHPGDHYGIYSVAFSPDGKWVLSGNKDGRARLWDWRTGQLVCPPLLHPDEVLDADFTPDGKHALTGVRNGPARLWELTTGRLVAPVFSYPIPKYTSTDTLTILGTRALVGAIDYPIVEFGPLLEDPATSTDNLLALAELATGGRIDQGDVTALAVSEWTERWNSLRDQQFVRKSFADVLVRDLDATEDHQVRQLIVERAARSQALLAEVAAQRPELPEVLVTMARIAAEEGDPRAAEYRARAIAKYEALWEEHPRDPTLTTSLARLLEHDDQAAPSQDETVWHPLHPTELTSAKQAVFTVRDDGAILVSGPDERGDQYTLSGQMPIERVTAVRLEVLTDPSLPQQGPGRHASGNFQLSAIRLFHAPHDPAATLVPSAEQTASQRATTRSSFADAWASYTWPGDVVDFRAPIREGSRKSWHIWSRTGTSHTAVYALREPLTATRQQPWKIELVNNLTEDTVNLGCFRLSVCDDDYALDRLRSDRTSASILYPWVSLARCFQQLGQPEKAARARAIALDQINDLRTAKSFITHLAMRSGALNDTLATSPQKPLIHMALAQHFAERGDVEQANAQRGVLRQLYEHRLAATPPDTAAADGLAELLLEQHEPSWKTFDPAEVSSHEGATVMRLEDDYWQSQFMDSPGDSLTVRGRSPLPRVSALRLETLPRDAELLLNSHLTEIRVSRRQLDGTLQPLRISRAAADMVRKCDSSCSLLNGPWGVFDGTHQTRWDVWPEPNQPHWLVLQLESPCEFSDQDELIVELDCLDPVWHQAKLNRFRISCCDDSAVADTYEMLAAVRRRALTGMPALAGSRLVLGDFKGARELVESEGTTARDEPSRLLLLAWTQSTLEETESAKATWNRFAQSPGSLSFLRPLQPRILELAESLGGMSRTDAEAWLAERYQP